MDEKHELPKGNVEEGERINSPTYIKNVQDDDVRGGRAQLIGCLHPNLVRREECEVARNVAGVALLRRAVTNALLLCAVPPEHANKEKDHPDDSASAHTDGSPLNLTISQTDDPRACGSHLSLYLRVYLVWMWISPRPPGLHLQLRSLVLWDQHVKFTGFSGGTGENEEMETGVVEGDRMCCLNFAQLLDGSEVTHATHPSCRRAPESFFSLVSRFHV